MSWCLLGQELLFKVKGSVIARNTSVGLGNFGRGCLPQYQQWFARKAPTIHRILNFERQCRVTSQGLEYKGHFAMVFFYFSKLLKISSRIQLHMLTIKRQGSNNIQHYQLKKLQKQIVYNASCLQTLHFPLRAIYVQCQHSTLQKSCIRSNIGILICSFMNVFSLHQAWLNFLFVMLITSGSFLNIYYCARLLQICAILCKSDCFPFLKYYFFSFEHII